MASRWKSAPRKIADTIAKSRIAKSSQKWDGNLAIQVKIRTDFVQLKKNLCESKWRSTGQMFNEVVKRYKYNQSSEALQICRSWNNIQLSLHCCDYQKPYICPNIDAFKRNTLLSIPETPCQVNFKFPQGCVELVKWLHTCFFCPW